MVIAYSQTIHVRKLESEGKMQNRQKEYNFLLAENKIYDCPFSLVTYRYVLPFSLSRMTINCATFETLT
jgi:hypothetical protein